VLLEWSWEGTLYYEKTLEKVAAAYVYPDAVAVVGSEPAVVQVAGLPVISKCGIPELPPQAGVSLVKALLGEVYAGALSPKEAGSRLRRMRTAPPVYPRPPCHGGRSIRDTSWSCWAAAGEAKIACISRAPRWEPVPKGTLPRPVCAIYRSEPGFS